MDHMIMYDNHIESISSDLFNPPVQSGISVWRHGFALSHRIPSLQVFFYKYIYSWFPCEFWMSSFSIPQHGPDQPICVCHLQVLRTLEEKLFEAIQ